MARSILNENRSVRTVIRSVAVVALVSLFAMPAAAAGMSGGWKPTAGHIARTTAHVVGILGGLVIMYYTNEIRRKTQGSTMARSSLLVLAGTGLFVLVFLGMESGHLLGIDLWYFTSTKAVTKFWWMTVLAVVLVLYTLSYRNIVKEMGV